MSKILASIFLFFALVSQVAAQSVGGTVIPDTYFQSGRPWCDVRAEGAVGNASADDTPAFNACRDKLYAVSPASNNGGILFVPPGNYCLNSGFSTSGIQNSAIRIVGTGVGAGLTACGHDVAVVTLGGGNSTIENVSITGKGVDGGGGAGSFGAGFNQPALKIAPDCVDCRILRTYVTGGFVPVWVQAPDTHIDDMFAASGYQTDSLLISNTTNDIAVWIYRGKFDHGSGLGTGVLTCSPSLSSMNVQASFNGTTMTVGTVNSGSIHLGDGLFGPTVSGIPVVTAFGTGTGGTGTYTVSINQGVQASNNVQCSGNNPPAWAPNTLYPLNQIVSSGGFYIQASQAGTSAGVAPTLNNYGTTITDNTVRWKLVSPVGAAGILCGQHCAEISIVSSDISGAYGGSPFVMNDPTASYVKIVSSVVSNVFGDSVINLANGKGFTITDSEIFGCSFITCPGINIQSTFAGQVNITSNWIGSSYHDILLGVGTANITGNHLSNAQFGVNVGSTANDFTITGNTCSNLVIPFNINSSTSDRWRIWANQGGQCWPNTPVQIGTNVFIDWGDGTFTTRTWFPLLSGFNRGATITGPSPGAPGAALMFQCGTNAGTAALYASAGTTNVYTRVIDNIGSGVSGC